VVVAVALGGSFGAVLRAVVAAAVSDLGAPGWSATLVVNVVGCLAIGALFIVLEHRMARRVDSLRLVSSLLMTGVLGGFTTFSTFSLEIVELARNGERSLAAAVFVLSLASCSGATALGAQIARGFAETEGSSIGS